MKKLSQGFSQLLASRSFWIGVLTVATLQGLWYIFSFAPILFDEKRHIDFIYLYTDYISPFIATQTPAMDFLGQVARESSYLYYYLMSIPLRVVEVFTSDYQIQVTVLRLINLGIFIWSLFVLKKTFIEMNVSKGIVHFALFVFILIPAVAPLAGVVTYDVGALLLIAYLLLISVRIYKKGRLTAQDITLFAVIAVLAAVIKYTTLPVTLALIVVLLIRVFWNRKSKLWSDIGTSFLKSNLLLKAVIIFSLVVSVAIFIERPVQNYFRYGIPNPGCMRTMPKDEVIERCSKNYVSLRSINFLAVKPDDFKPAGRFEFLFNTWIPGMVVSLSRQIPNTSALPVIHHFFYIVMIIGTAAILLAFREIIRKHKPIILLAAVLIVYILSVFLSNYGSYVHLGQPVAISARYFMPVIPIFLVLLGLSINILFKKQRAVKVFIVSIALLFLTQGGGVIAYLLQTPQDYYWKNDYIINANEFAKRAIQKIVNE